MTAIRRSVATQVVDGVTPFPTAPLAPPSPPGPPRVLFFVHNDTGLGHVRMTLALAEALAQRRPEVAMLAVTGASHFSRFTLPAHLDLLRLPWPRSDVPKDMPDYALVAQDLRSRVIQAALDGFAPDLVIVDFMPSGLRSELGAPLLNLRATRPDVKIVLSLRDIIDRPTGGMRWWWGLHGRHLIDEVYDAILVHGSQAVHDTIREYGFSEAAARKVTFCGYMQPSASIPAS